MEGISRMSLTWTLINIPEQMREEDKDLILNIYLTIITKLLLSHFDDILYSCILEDAGIIHLFPPHLPSFIYVLSLFLSVIICLLNKHLKRSLLSLCCGSFTVKKYTASVIRIHDLRCLTDSSFFLFDLFHRQLRINLHSPIADGSVKAQLVT